MLARSHALTVFVGVILLAVSAQIQIPLQPVPITLQSTVVMILGLFLSQRAAFQAVLAYVCLGVLGLPVFAGYSLGYGVLVGCTGGYLLGFVASVWVMTSMRQGLWLKVLLGMSIIYIFGVVWLSFYVGMNQAMNLGVLPFVIPELIKSFILVGIIKFLKY